jgi:CRP-like cAMP-binding protein
MAKEDKKPAIDWEHYQHLFKEMKVPAKTVLLQEGQVARQAYFIKKGCLRLGFNNQGKDVSFQFFFENEGVSSVESFRSGKPSQFGIESLEPCDLLVISKKNFDRLMEEVPGMKDLLIETLHQRVAHYFSLFLSRIKDSPEKRYAELLKECPHIIQRVPQHYIASYLGITPVSLSRIRNKSGRGSASRGRGSIS